MLLIQKYLDSISPLEKEIRNSNRDNMNKRRLTHSKYSGEQTAAGRLTDEGRESGRDKSVQLASVISLDYCAE